LIPTGATVLELHDKLNVLANSENENIIDDAKVQLGLAVSLTKATEED
jgi:hypothetical protein